MSPKRSRFVTACQQMLALGVVLAALTPAASVVSLDVVGTTPAAGGPARPATALAAYTAEAMTPSKVPTAPVRSHVREVQLTSPAGTAVRGVPTASARVARAPGGASRLTTTPQRVRGFGEVGVTWAPGIAIPETALHVSARTRTDGGWTRWSDVPYDPDHGPDPGSAEARHARPGTEPVLVGTVADVQVRVVSDQPLPPDMKLAVIAPGRARHSVDERAAIDTSTMDGNDGSDSVAAASALDEAATSSAGSGTGETAGLAAAVFTPQPVIYSRKQWGADESIRGKSSLHYGDVHAGFVHHTVNANDYTRSEVPGLLRSIYAYHVKSRGWSDIGYNYLVDRFGRIWEGRYGGVDRDVVGAHTLGYNDDSFAMSAIGNYQIAKPSKAMIQAYATLFAWKLSLHGVNAASTHQWVTKSWFEAINGHRDAASTLCPGQYLYNKIPRIRKLAAAAQRGWSGRQLESDLASTAAPDIVVRRASDGEAFVVPTGGLLHFPAATTVATGASGATQLAVTGDVTGDGRSDLLVRAADGSVGVRPGTAKGTFGPAAKTLTAFRGLDQLVAPGDIDGDGRSDLVARNPTTGRLFAFLQKAAGGFHRQRIGGAWASYDVVAGAGDLNGDGRPDLVARDAAGQLWSYDGIGKARFAAPVRVPGSFAKYDLVAGAGDLTHDGRGDLVVRQRKTGDSFVLPGKGDGTFSHKLGPITRFAGARHLAVGNVSGSKAADVVALDSGRVRAWINPGGFDLGKPRDTHANLSRADRILVVGDWDRDGHGDVVTRQGKHGNLVLWRGNGHGRLTRAATLGSGFDTVTRLTAVGDMTGDGYPDLIGQPKKGVMTVYPGKGVAGLKKSYPVYGSITSGTPIGVGRWDADGAPDTLLRRGASVLLLHGNGPGGLHSPSTLKSADLTRYDWAIGVSDLRLTGHPDLIVREKKTGRLYAVPGTAKGLGTPVFLGGGFAGYDLAG